MSAILFLICGEIQVYCHGQINVNILPSLQMQRWKNIKIACIPKVN